MRLNMKAIWQAFVMQDTGRYQDPASLDRLNIKPWLKESWLRCRRQQRHDHWPPQLYAKGITFDSLCRNKSEMLNIASPIIEDIFEYLDAPDCAIFVTDETGCTLNFYATPSMATRLAALGIRASIYWREGMMGNNAISSALLLHETVSVKGHEHFNQHLHPFAISATPIFDSDSTVAGAAGIVLLSSHETVSALGLALVHSVGQQISARLNADLILAESNQHLSEVHALLDGVGEGVLAWDNKGTILYLNLNGSALLGIKGEKIAGKNIHDLIRLPQSIVSAIAQNREIDLPETALEFDGAFISLAISLKIVKGRSNTPDRYIALLYPAERFHQQLPHDGGGWARLTFDDLDTVGTSRHSRRVVRLAQQAAKGRGSVLLHGEEGLGKSSLAQAIHHASERQDKPFITINCQAMPRETMVSEFPGGNINGIQPLVSKFELARGGTLLLENIECLTAEVQTALMQLLKTGLLSKASQPLMPLDVRLITTTTVDINQYVEENRFRRHLLYELQSFDIHIPPLRERSEDIPPLIKRYLKIISHEVGKGVSLSDDVLRLLMRYRWPGNHRELRNVLERAYRDSDGAMIQVKDIPAALITRIRDLTDIMPVKGLHTLNDMERDALIQAAIHYHGKAIEITQALQISRTSLWRKLKAFNIHLEDYKAR